MEIYIARDGNRLGPFSLEEVQRQLASGQLTLADLGWTRGALNWMPLASFPPLQSGADSPPLPPPISPVRDLNPAPPAASAVPPALRAETSGAAIASLVLGIASFMMLPVFGNIAAVICGHMARRDIRRSGGTLNGDGMAIAGLVLGYVGLLVVVLLGIAAYAFFVSTARHGRTDEMKTLANGKQIAAACVRYAADHGDRFPYRLEDLVPKYLPDAALLTSSLPQSDREAYIFTDAGGSRNDPPKKVLLLSKYREPNGNRIIVHVDGSAEIGPPSTLD